LIFYNSRYYDSYLNHFTQPDSIVPDPYNSQDYDRYAYARNNPIRYNDPSGHEPGDCYDRGYCTRNQALLLKPPKTLRLEERIPYINAVAEKYGIHLSSTDVWGYSHTDTIRLGQYDQREETDYAFSPNGSRVDDYYNDNNEFIETPDNQVTVFKRTFDECDSADCVAGILAHEATHSWVEWLIDENSSLPRTDQVPAEEVLADQVALEISPANSIIIGRGIDQKHLTNCMAVTHSECTNPAQILSDYYGIEDIFNISNLVYGR